MMTNKEFVKKALDIANNYKTLYVYGCFGAPMSTKLGKNQGKYRYANNNTYNRREPKHSQIMNASEDTFGFDCVCTIKGIVWGWCGKTDKIYGGATYNTGILGDYNANGLLLRACYDASTDFSNIELGEILWMDGHVGIYVGNGEAVECTDRWTHNVLKSTVANIKAGGKYSRKWTKHAKLYCIEYIKDDVKIEEPIKEKEPVKEDVSRETFYSVQKGDTLSKIAGIYGTTVDKLLELNKETHKKMTRNFICVGWKLKIEPGVK